MTALRISGGAVYDPANGIDGVVQDLCIEDGRIVAAIAGKATTLDATGMVVMPGGVDIHSHVAGHTVNLARRMQPAEHRRDPAPAAALIDGGVGRSGTGGTVPSTFTTGYRYAGLGYTTVFDAAVAPLLARSSHAEFDDTPIVDGGFFVLLGNDDYLLQLLARGDLAAVTEYVAWILGATGGYAIKVVNPGGIARWKDGARDGTGLDTEVGPGVTPRLILRTLAAAADHLDLPHGAHIHCNGLGLPGNAVTTLDSMRSIDARAHFTHIQFHSYGAAADGRWCSGAREVIEYLNGHPHLTADVGQVMFGPATTLSADGPVGYMLHKSGAGGAWSNVDIEMETGCGIVPHTYRERAAVAALQWVIGLELFLLASDPWRVVLSTDHPNGGSFAAYPELIRLLMDRTYRDDRLKRVNPRLLAGSALADGLAREFTLGEIATITRAAPARILGLRDKGHLGVGADADITIYAPDDDASVMFATPRYVIKRGLLVVEEGQLRRAPSGDRLYVRPAYDCGIEARLRDYFDRRSTIAFDNFPVGTLPGTARPTERRA